MTRDCRDNNRNTRRDTPDTDRYLRLLCCNTGVHTAAGSSRRFSLARVRSLGRCVCMCVCVIHMHLLSLAVDPLLSVPGRSMLIPLSVPPSKKNTPCCFEQYTQYSSIIREFTAAVRERRSSLCAIKKCRPTPRRPLLGNEACVRWKLNKPAKVEASN